MRSSAAGIATSLLVVFGCGAKEDAPRVTNAALPPGVVARVANLDVHGSIVSKIAAASNISPGAARERAVADALFAAEARARLGEAEKVTIERAALGRTLLQNLLEESEKRGPPSDGEIERLTRERWVDLDRPASARVTHAVALRPQGGSATAAHRVAVAIAEAVRGVTDPKAFMDAAKAVPHDGVDVRAERLPAMTPEGRGFSLEGAGAREAGSFDPLFARAANALSTPGEQSPIVETTYGFHVLLLEAKLPELRSSLEDRRRVLEKEVLARRAGDSRRALIEGLSRQVSVEVARDFDARTAGLGGS